MGFSIGSDRDRTIAIAPLFVVKGAMEQLTEIFGFEALQSKQARTTHKRFVDFEVRVFSGGTDQGESAVLDPRKQRILLRTVEAMDFIDEQDGELEVSAISFKDDILSYEYSPPKSESGKEKESKDKESKEEDWLRNMATWLKVKGNTFKGAVCPGEKSEIDFSVEGQKRDGTP